MEMHRSWLFALGCLTAVLAALWAAAQHVERDAPPPRRPALTHPARLEAPRR